MADTTVLPAANQVDDEMTLQQILSEMQYLRERMDSDQAEIERLRTATRALQAETRAMLATIKAMV